MEAVVERAANLEEAAECEAALLFPSLLQFTKKNNKRRRLVYQPWLAWYHLVLEATAADPLGALLSRAMVADKVELEARLQNHFASPSHSMENLHSVCIPTDSYRFLQALLGESARRASAFEDELDNQRLP